MKIKLSLIVASMFLFAACQNEEHGQDHEHANTATEVHTSDGKTLALNNGAKWQTDESTRQHAAALQGIADGFPFNENTTLEAFHNHAEAMQTELNYLIQDCRMKGAEHDALHLWLEPVLEDTRQVSETSDAAAAQAATKQLHEDIRKFPQYFQ